ncbi:hypothetical protein M378DRAFT_157830 [Amanita muscaria Koide BX008]|uniref:Putative 5'-nucleotidase C-terminal domain-containing protein n=1 Tax=Amanita muscaria (strain Koide BX008) TaxID=946122 RepID=A0A0C2SYW3_AMAMK|nr:hypothetical protein M378DRAFT_157830 [Amanita muscaria Koide BX008]
MTRLVKFNLVAGLLALIPTSYSCSEDHDHDHTLHKRSIPSAQLTPPWRPLQWGDVNIIHTTDSHGWLLGHQKKSFPEPNYSGDFGDFASFVAHMKQIALERDVDLLLVDSGDLHDGTGLSDGYPPGGVDAHDSNQFFKQLPYDLLSIGNHELYIYANTLDMYQNFVPHFNGRYLSSNVNITIADAEGNPISVPVGSRYAKFQTRKGRRVTAFGVLYDFTGNDHNTTVQTVENMVKEDWFLQAIADEPDFFLLVGHMPVSQDNWPAVFNAIRAVHPYTPILIFGGHSHIRDCNQLDSRSMSLESGRYMETVGWMSVELTKANLTFSRRYLDPNRVTYEYHTQTSNQTFDTSLGKSITNGLLALWQSFNLGYEFGTAPQDYYLNRAPYPSNSSLLTELGTKALPYALTVNNTRGNIPNIIIVNTGSQRFDLYAGSFNKNDQLTISPFTDAFQFIANVSLSVASQVLPTLNGLSAAKRSLDGSYERGDVEHIYRAWLERMSRVNVWEERDTQTTTKQNLTLGYVTQDSCPGVGDDTLHTPLPSYSIPNFIGSPMPNLPNNATVDLIFVDFIGPYVVDVLNVLQTQKVYTTADIGLYTPVLADQVWGIYAQSAWN